MFSFKKQNKNKIKFAYNYLHKYLKQKKLFIYNISHKQIIK